MISSTARDLPEHREEMVTYRQAPGDFSRWRADHPQFDPTTLPLVQSRTHILAHALAGMTDDVRDVLHTLVGFRLPATYDTLVALRVGADKTYARAQGLDTALAELEDRGLIGWDRGANRYDAHTSAACSARRVTLCRVALLSEEVSVYS